TLAKLSTSDIQFLLRCSCSGAGCPNRVCGQVYVYMFFLLPQKPAALPSLRSDGVGGPQNGAMAAWKSQHSSIPGSAFSCDRKITLTVLLIGIYINGVDIRVIAFLKAKSTKGSIFV